METPMAMRSGRCGERNAVSIISALAMSSMQVFGVCAGACAVRTVMV